MSFVIKPMALQVGTVKQAGFTLIEWIAVMVFLGVVGAVAAPSLMAVRQAQQFKNAVASVKGELISAQSQAIRDSEQLSVIFDLSGAPIFLESQDSTGSTIRTVELSDDIDLSSQGFTASSGLSFSFKGTSPNVGDFVSISHANNSDLNACVGIANILGRVYEGEVSGGTCNE